MRFHRLYVRIWLAVLLAVAVLSLLVGWVWRVTSEPPLREVVVRNANGEIIGAGVLRLGRPNQSGGPQGDPPGTRRRRTTTRRGVTVTGPNSLSI